MYNPFPNAVLKFNLGTRKAKQFLVFVNNSYLKKMKRIMTIVESKIFWMISRKPSKNWKKNIKKIDLAEKPVDWK